MEDMSIKYPFAAIKRFLQNTMSGNPNIIIIGAGAAGIAGAVKLQEYGFTNIKILEAENRIGGRINTIDFGQSVVDLGAQWCHGEEDNIVYEYVHKLNLLETSKCNYKDNVFYDSRGNPISKKLTDNLFAIAASITYDYEMMQNNDSSFGNYFIQRYIENVKKEFGSNQPCLDVANMFVHWFHKLILCYDAPPSWFDISASGLLQYKDCEGDPLLNWKNKGYRVFLDVLMNNYPKYNRCNAIEDMIMLNKEVKHILWRDNYSAAAIVKCSDGTSYFADHVIVTTSIGVLKEQHKSIFIPELPFYKSNAIEAHGFGTVNKIIVKFPNQWWNVDDTCFCFAWTEDDRMNILNEFPAGPIKNGKSWLEDINGFYTIDSDTTILIAWMVGEFVGDVEMLDDHIIKKGCVYLLNKFLGDKFEIPDPEKVICSKWNSNPHFRGSYSYKSVEGDRRHTTSQDLSEPLFGSDNKPLIMFAGEATHPYYYSTVHGAVETGFREANRIVDYYKSPHDSKDRPKLNSKY